MPVRVATPVPPFATTRVPPTVMAPDVAVEGVRPVEANEIVVTADDTELQDGRPLPDTVRV
jgi:hypothetical protein